MKIQMMFRGLRTTQATVAALLIVGSTGCMKEVLPFDNESISSLTGAPTPNSLATAAQGMLRAIRVSVVGQGSYTSYWHSLAGRVRARPGHPGLVPETMVGPLLPSTRNDWADNYRAIQTGQIILTALDNVTGLTDPQKEAVRGFVKRSRRIALSGSSRPTI